MLFLKLKLFAKMNHRKIYESIIENAKSKNRKKLKKNHPNYIYYENHHILPVCLSGNNEKNNLVLLTAREHFICHKLLTYIYKGNRKIACAFHKMSFGNHNDKYKISSKDYAYARELISLTLISNETRKKLSDATKGENNAQWGKPGFATGHRHSIETKIKMSDDHKGEKNSQWGKKGELSTNWGKTASEHTKQKQSVSQKKRLSNKENHPRFGKHCSKETKNKISKSNIERNILKKLNQK